VTRRPDKSEDRNSVTKASATMMELAPDEPGPTNRLEPV